MTELTKFSCSKCNYAYTSVDDKKTDNYFNISGNINDLQLIFIDKETFGINIICEGCGTTTQLIVKECKRLKK